MIKLLRNFIILAVFSPLVFNSLGATAKTPKPNIVLIVIDALRADHLPFYGYAKNTAPTLARLAQESVIFDNAYSVSAFTSPATASIFTAFFPLQHGLLSNTFFADDIQNENVRELMVAGIPRGMKTIAEFLKQNGYRTFGVSQNPNICKEAGFTRGFDRFQVFDYTGAAQLNNEIREMWYEDIRENQPYFLYVHYMDPHAPYHQRRPWPEETGDALGNTISAYDSEINYLDRHIRHLFDFLNWQENTLVIITADHGEEFNEHGVVGHGLNLYQEVLRVPLMFYGPREFGKGKRIKAFVSTMDIYPTVCELLGARPDKKFKGKSLLAYIKKVPALPDDRYVYSHLIPYRNQKTYPPITSIISKDWKYIESAGKQELYNLKDDPGEKTNLFAASPELVQTLKKQLKNFLKTCRPFKQDFTPIPKENYPLQELRALGYLQ